MANTIKNIFDGAGTVLAVYPRPTGCPVAQDLLNRSDAEAIAHDWQVVGLDLYRAIQQFPDAYHADIARGFISSNGARDWQASGQGVSRLY